MKKIMTKIVCGMMLVCLFAASVSAVALEPQGENSAQRTLSETEVYAMVAEAFPEDSLLSRNASQPIEWDSINQILTSCETRALSDTEQVTRLKYSNGARAYVSSVDFYQNSSSSTGSSQTINTDVYLTVYGYNGVLYIHGLDYTINYSYNDMINNKGEASMGGSSTGCASHLTRAVENSSGPATATYSGMFEQPLVGASYTIVLQVYIGNNQRTYAVL